MKLGWKTVIVTMLCLLIVPWQVWSESAYNFKAQTPMNAALRSLLIPSWGQFFNEQSTKGLIFAGAEAVSIGAAFMLHAKANSTYEDYEQKRTDTLYDDYSSQFDTANMLVYLSAAIWVWNVVDAYISAGAPAAPKKKNDDFDSKLPWPEKFNLQLCQNKELRLQYRYQF